MDFLRPQSSVTRRIGRVANLEKLIFSTSWRRCGIIMLGWVGGGGRGGSRKTWIREISPIHSKCVSASAGGAFIRYWRGKWIREISPIPSKRTCAFAKTHLPGATRSEYQARKAPMENRQLLAAEWYIFRGSSSSLLFCARTFKRGNCDRKANSQGREREKRVEFSIKFENP